MNNNNNTTDNDMRVTKRDGNLEEMSFDKILNRIKKLGQEVGIQINYSSLVMKVIDQLYDKIETAKIDELAAEQCASLSTQHPDYGVLASRIVISNHQKNTETEFSNIMKSLYEFVDIHGTHKPLIAKYIWDFIEQNSGELDTMIDHNRDYLIDFFGFKTLERAYLFRLNNKIVERIQHMWLRVSVGIHVNPNGGCSNHEIHLRLIKETYDLMSQKYFTHATPTLFNAGTPRPQLSSCYLIAMEDDSLDGIYNTLKDCAIISKWAGGIGLHIHNIRAKGSHIHGTNGASNGIVPMLRVFNNTARYVDQCVHPETIIYTTNGPIQIQHCSLGETKIFNVNGECETIENVLEHPYEGEIYNIETMHCIDNLKVTPEHPLFVLRDQKKGLNYNVIKNRLDKKIASFEWVDVKELTHDDMLVYRIPEYSFDIQNLTEDDCYMYGIILGDGSMHNEDQNGYLSLHTTNKKHILDFAVNYFEKKYTQYRIYVDENTTRIRWNKNLNMPFRYNDVYDVHKNKYIHSKWLNLPISKSKFILKGLLDTDGCNYKELVFDNTSRSLIEGVRFICMKMGVLTSGYIRDRVGESHDTKRGIITNKKISYCLRVPKTKDICDLMNISYDENQFFKFFKYNKYLLTRIKNITKEEYSGTLYDLHMKDEHNYMLHNGLVKNGGGKRNGSFAIYLEPWHPDIEDFLEMKKNHGDEESKARDLFYALWISDLFMERVKENGKWSLLCPNECPGLSDVYGEKFVELYTKYEASGKARKTVNARDLWFKILDAQMETGTPYLLFKDAANKKSNQQNLGTIKSSNLCTEILEYSDDKETAVCNLASIALPTFVDEKTKMFDYDKLHQVTKVVTNNLNKVIDVNFYPTEKTQRSNMLHRPIGIGVQGLADAFILMDIPFHSDEAKEVNKLIFETIYHAALEKSNEISIAIKEQYSSQIDFDSDVQLIYETKYTNGLKHGLKTKHIGAYQSFENSPASKGILQFDMWGVEPTPGRYDWQALKQSIVEHGMRNSLLLAPMPTASTSQILGFNECFEPFTSNLYSRRTLAGEFVVVNKYLMKELIDLGLWNEQIKNNIIANKGSVQQLSMLSEHVKNKYKIVWEMPMKHLIDMSADRGAFICQSQSMNLWVEDPTYNTLTSMHFYSWKKGLKTGIYYLRRKAKHQAQQFTIEPENKKVEEKDEICEMCSA
jgi:ribonucleotide reductase alpha subunit